MTSKKEQNDAIKVNAIKRETLSEKIIGEIKSLIDDGQITHGSRLPSEREFAQMLRVSRPSLREAIKALSVLGIIVNKHGEGNFLSDDHDNWPSEPLSIFFSLKKGALIDLYEARKGLEMQAVSLAAERRTPDDITKMRSALNKMRQSISDADDFYRYDMHFHLAINAATKNEVIIDLLGKIHKLSVKTRDLLWKTGDKYEADAKHDLAKHEKLFEYIVAGEAENAAADVGKHIDELLQKIKSNVVRGKIVSVQGVEGANGL